MSSHISIEISDPFSDREWLAEVDSSPRSTAFHSNAWIETLRKAYGYKASVASIRRGSNRLLSLPFFEVDVSFSPLRAVSLPFSDSCEPLGAEPSRYPELIDGLIGLGQKKVWKTLELRGGASNFPNANPSTEFWRHDLSLEDSKEELWKRLNSATRRAIRKFRQSSVRLSERSSESELVDFYGLVVQTRKRQGLPPQPFPFFERLWDQVISKGNGRIVLAYSDNIPVAGALFLTHRQHAIYKFGASDKRFQELRANNGVMWTAIEALSSEGFETLDFGRTSVGADGLRRFKLGWGTREWKDAYLLYDFTQSAWINAPDRSSGWHNRLFCLMPTPILRGVGSLIYKRIA